MFHKPTSVTLVTGRGGCRSWTRSRLFIQRTIGGAPPRCRQGAKPWAALSEHHQNQVLSSWGSRGALESFQKWSVPFPLVHPAGWRKQVSGLLHLGATRTGPAIKL